MYRKRVLPILIFLLSVVWITSSASAVEIKTLSLGKAIEIAMEANIRLKQASNQVTLGSISVKQKKSNFYPDLSVSARSSERYSKEYDTDLGKNVNLRAGSLSLGASTTFNIFNGFYDKASLQQSELELKSTTEDLNRTRQSIIFETIQRFIQVITSGELIQVEKENLEAQRILLDRIDEYYKLGKRPITDLYQQKAQISNAEFQLLNAQRNYDVNKLLLTQTLGLQPETDFEVVNPGVDRLVGNVVEFHSEEILKEALAKRSDLNAQRLQIEAAWKAIKAAKSGYLPKLSFSADLGTSYSDMTKSFSFSDQLFKNNINGSIGLSLSIPVFDKFRTRYSVASANVNLKNQQLGLESLKQQVGLEVQQAIKDYQTAGKQLNVSEDQLKYSKDALDSIQERYNVNSATLMELTQTRAQYLDSMYNRIQAKFNLLIRGIAVAFYKGDSDEMIKLLETK